MTHHEGSNSFVELRSVEGGSPEGEAVPGEAAKVSMVSLANLRRGPVLRVMGEDHAHARLLACTPVPLPPILVERSTMRVIDGLHRVLAARMRGATTIAAYFFEGTEAEAFLAAVRANIEHGKPLSLADREHAAERLVTLHPDWSDRGIAETCGLSPKTAGRVRARASVEIPHLHTRVGKDGRARPVDPDAGRQRISAALIADPDAPLREIARRTATSVGTVRSVRRRLEEGKPAGADGASESGDLAISSRTPGQQWVNDTACASSEDATGFARWFDANQIRAEEAKVFQEAVPLSRTYAVIAEARARSQAWAEFAAALETRTRRMGSVRPVE